jgi:hypothetical protein
VVRFESFRNFVSKHAFNRYCWWNTEFFVKCDHGPPAQGGASFHTTRWTIVMRAAQSQVQGGQSALAWAVKKLIHPFRKRHTALLREEVGRSVSEPAEIDEEIHALCEALVAYGGRLGP